MLHTEVLDVERHPVRQMSDNAPRLFEGEEMRITMTVIQKTDALIGLETVRYFVCCNELENFIAAEVPHSREWGLD